MVIVDNDRRCAAANRATRLLFRLRRAQLVGRRVGEVTPPHMVGAIETLWAQLMQAGVAAGVLEVSLTDGGRLRLVYCAMANVLPGQHLIVLAPADWPEDELGTAQFGPPGPIAGPLSQREREVLTLIAAGADLKEVGEELTISRSTVRTHAENAHRKLGARNRAHAIALAMNLGLIDPPSNASGVGLSQTGHH
jgi:DNA-binding CsgD family transcriptional regulator